MSSTNNNITCANCGKGGEGEDINLKACTACKLVKYCNRDCQIAHRPQHKKTCKKRAAELYDEQLFSEPPPREECPICMLLIPLAPSDSTFEACCGRMICNGCIHAMVMEEIRKGKKKEEWGMCPFCRTTSASSDEEVVKRLKRRIEKGNADAMYNFAVYYAEGSNGMPQDWAKANELLLKAGELGCAEAYSKLGNSYIYGRGGVEIDTKKAKYYLELAAMKGDVDARHNLGCVEGQAGNEHRAVKHFLLAAKAGHPGSLDSVKQGFMAGLVTKHEYGNTLRAYQTRVDEMKSKARDKATMIAQSGEG